jgi:hypothetical protein
MAANCFFRWQRKKAARGKKRREPRPTNGPFRRFSAWLVSGVTLCIVFLGRDGKGFAAWASCSRESHIQYDKLTVQDLESLCPNVNRRSLQRDFKGMLGQGLIMEVGSGATDPTRHYVLADCDKL